MPATLNNQPRETGFSLVELMIALVLGLFIIGGVASVFVGSTQSFNSNEALSRVQENGRFALDMIAEELRNAGYKGSCVNNVLSHLNDSNANYEEEAHDLNTPMWGWADDDGEFFAGLMNNYVNPTASAASDVIIIKHAAEAAAVTLSSDLAQNEINFPITGGADLDQIILLSDPFGCDLFQNTANNALSRSGGSSIGNSLGNLSHEYKADETNIQLFSSTIFYIGSGTTAPTALRSISYDNGIPNAASDQELVEGVTELAFEYGVVSGAGPALNYVSVDNSWDADDWNDVVAVRVSFTVVGDQNIQHDFSTTVALRNRLE